MSDARDNVILFFGLAALAYAAYVYLAPSLTGGDSTSGDGGDQSSPTDAGGAVSGPLDTQSIYDYATQALSVAGISDVTPQMLTTIAMIESGGDPSATRQEPRIGDASYGLCQVLLGTATWLYNNEGATAFGAPTAAMLLTPEGSAYFGACYLHWLRNYQGSEQPDAFVVAAYNGGPSGASGPGPQRYLASYNSMASQLGFA